MNLLVESTSGVLRSRRIVRHLTGAMAFLLLLSVWRPAPASAASSTLHAHIKRARRSFSELPESRVLGSRRRVAVPAEKAVSLLLRTKRASPSGCSETRLEISDQLRRPRYLQAFLTLDIHAPLAPPAC